MKESHQHIARLSSFSIMEEIILSKVKRTNISEVKPSDWQQAKGLFSAAFTRDSGQDVLGQVPAVRFHYLKSNFQNVEPVWLLLHGLLSSGSS